ncbi:uridine kinase family protein [Carnobacterium inhibens]|uniref:Phosphoribulokinase n=1 Tax=Carnobacterium inhibens subsp. gilichinskyi TaxID=1266845 RepID=U5SBI8_9LACT|nr:phosphoribulokinase [Carnobacterium inhibens]AGY82436.1 phosphoribulokinase [Carnobacterium inhibens subsp. gilichinskyi]
MNNLLDEVINWINKSDKPVIIGISGHGAAGKTTFSTKLAHLIGLNEVAYINTDPYMITSQLRQYTIIQYRYQNKDYHSKMTACHPDAHHIVSLERDIRMVKSGLDFYTIDTFYSKSELISPKKVTIIEGMSVAFVDPELIDLKIYFYTDDETELMRRVGRDVLERGTDINALRQSHKQRRIQYELFMHPYRKTFDMIIKNSDEEIWVEKNLLASPE